MRTYEATKRKKTPYPIFRNRNLKRYGITQDDFDNLIVSQDHKCAICKTDTPGGRGTWHVDHCHKTLMIRGLLCTNCNTGLGRFKDNQAFLISAQQYLSRVPEHVLA